MNIETIEHNPVSMETLAREIGVAVISALGASAKTNDPMNALIVWTELGKGLAGKLARQGADVGLLGQLIARYCNEGKTETPVDLSKWMYQTPKELRLSPEELGRAMARTQREIGNCLADKWQGGDVAAHSRLDFLATVRGWFPVGLFIIRSFPGADNKSDADVRAALWAWCERYLPKDTSGPEDLGVRRIKQC